MLFLTLFGLSWLSPSGYSTEEDVPRIEIDDALQSHLARSSYHGEALSDTIRRLLGLRDAASLQGAERELLSFVRSDNLLLQHETVTDRFLAALEFLSRKDPGEFQQLIGLRGKSRVYFARTRAQVEKAGRTTWPRRIEGSGYWVVTNLRTKQKLTLLTKVLRLMGYGEEVGKEVRRALTRDIPVPHRGG